MPKFSIHPHLQDLEAAVHGGAGQLVAQNLNPAELDDFSASILPLSPPSAVERAIVSADARAYPDPACTRLRQTIASQNGLNPEQVLCANGSVALIQAVVRACLSAGSKALIVGPTFGEYAAAVHSVGAEVIEVRTPHADEVLHAIAQHDPALVFLCNPNNPTGHLWSTADVDRIAAAAPLVLDEAYAGFLRPPPPPAAGPGRLVLRSLTKDHALAGLRIGYAVGEPALLSVLEKLLAPWGVSTAAQAAALAALQNPSPYRAAIDALWEERDRLMRAIKALGFPVEDSSVPFFLVDVGDAAGVSAQLLTSGVVVRDCTSFGLPKHLRISPQTPDAGNRLLAALRGEPVHRASAAGRIVVVLGGARSGKSQHAERLAEELGGDSVTYIATAEIWDQEMEKRIEKHRLDRPSSWQTIEEPQEAAEALKRAEHDTVLLDCLTLLCTNLLLGQDEQAVYDEIARLIDAARQRRGTLIVVSNEVGSGIVPENKLARQFRDLQGISNRQIAEAADRVLKVVAGQVLTLKED